MWLPAQKNAKLHSQSTWLVQLIVAQTMCVSMTFAHALGSKVVQWFVRVSIHVCGCFLCFLGFRYMAPHRHGISPRLLPGEPWGRKKLCRLKTRKRAFVTLSALAWVSQATLLCSVAPPSPLVLVAHKGRQHRLNRPLRRSLDVLHSLEGYESLLDAEVATDVATAATLNAASDIVAQSSETKDSRISSARVLRYAIFGSLDGFAGHHWFEALDAAPKTGDLVLDTVAKVLADSLLYTPCWCVAFLMVMAILEGRGLQAGVAEVQRDFLELLRGNYGFTLPFVALIYALAPVSGGLLCGIDSGLHHSSQSLGQRTSTKFETSSNLGKVEFVSPE
eukprot:s1306_g21.t1